MTREEYNAYQRAKYAIGGEERRRKQREYRSNNRDHCCRLQRKSYLRHREARLQANRNRVGYNTRKSWLMRLKRLGLSEQDYLSMFAQQEGKCAICRRVETGRFAKLCVDHCHSSGRVRGLLCNRCNQALGLLGDSPETLRKATAYLDASTQ